jgi:membrane protease YdiL (CAAX protease family)
MSAFERTTLAGIALWLVLVLWRPRSVALVVGGLLSFGVLSAIALRGATSAAELGLRGVHAWPLTIAVGACWLPVMIAASPLADRVASALVSEPPRLQAFERLQRSPLQLLLGLIAACVLGGVLEELAVRGVVLQSVERFARTHLPAWAASASAILVAAGVAALFHSYQGRRAVLIIGQLSVLFGVLFVLSAHDLYAVMLCHALYDSIAFVRFARGSSRYSQRMRGRPPAT